MNDEERQGRSKRRDKTPKRSPSKIGTSHIIFAPVSPPEKQATKTPAKELKTPGKSTVKKSKSPDKTA